MKLIFVGKDLEPKEVIDFVVEKKISHFIQNDQNLRDELAAVSVMVNETEKFFLETTNVILGGLTSKRDWPSAELIDKAILKDEIFGFFAPHGNKALLQSVDAIFEELYMNAKLDAPRNSPRGTDQGQFSFHAAVDPTQGVLVCRDSFGSLNTEIFIGRMQEIYQKGRGEVMNFGSQGGAGIGCVILFENCAGLYLGVDEGVQTVVSCVLPLKMGGRQRSEHPKSLHLVRTKKIGRVG